MISKPLLAASTTPTKVKLPAIVSPKHDGIRCLIVNGKAVSRTFKPIPNDHVRSSLEDKFKDFFGVYDGEITIHGLAFNEISSAIMSKEGTPDFTYTVFDCVVDLKEPYCDRLNRIPQEFRVESVLVESFEHLEAVHKYNLESGYEGTMVRLPKGIYKQGRSTQKEGILLRIKPLEDSEARIIDFVEQMENMNQIQQNEVGTNKRPLKKSGMVPKDTLGALSVKDLKSGVEFELSSGLTQAQRDEIWKNKDAYLGKLVKYKYQKHGTVKKPRNPVFIGFRHQDDLG